MPEYEVGFRSLDRERRAVDLPIEGQVPTWLDGALIRNGPGKFETADGPVSHWFDGLAMLRKFSFDDGTVRYTNRFLRSQTYRDVVETGSLSSGQFGTGASRGLLGRIRDAVLPSPTDNANVNVLQLGERFVAITETPLGIEFDPDTLETIGRWEFDDDVTGQLTTAHPHRDPRREEFVNYVTEFGRTSSYHVYRIPFGDTTRERIGSVTAESPAYMHSFGLTPHYVVLAEFPLVVNPFRFFLPGGGSFIEHYEWTPDRGTRFIVMDRDTGEVIADPRADPFFCFHHVNAFEADDELVVDLVAFEDASAISALYLDELRSDGIPDLDGQLRRYRVSLDGEAVAYETLYDRGMTLPRIALGRDTNPYRYAYGQGTPDASGQTPQRLVKVDTETETTAAWIEDGTYCGEPVVVRRPGGNAEDDGVVLSVILDTDAEQSFVLVLDAGSFEELARAAIPDILPFDFHGQFFPHL